VGTVLFPVPAGGGVEGMTVVLGVTMMLNYQAVKEKKQAKGCQHECFWIISHHGYSLFLTPYCCCSTHQVVTRGKSGGSDIPVLDHTEGRLALEIHNGRVE
jgi:hypothetical protein